MGKINKNIIIGILVAIIFVLGFYAMNNRQANVRDFVLPYGDGSIAVDEFGDVMAQGTWVASSQREGHNFLTDQVNKVEIYCYKDAGKCHEERAMLTRLDKKSKYDLFTFNFEYDIKEWNVNYIKAEMSGPGRVFELDINFNNKKVMLSIRDNPENPTASAYVDTATLENAFNVWDSLRTLND